MSLIALAQAASVVDETPCQTLPSEIQIDSNNIDESPSCTTNPSDSTQNLGTEPPV